MTPTPDDIDAVIFDMITQELTGAEPHELDELWTSVARDRQGEFRGCGFGLTPAEAHAGAWITAWWPELDLRAVPRTVEAGWSFELYPPGEPPILRRG